MLIQLLFVLLVVGCGFAVNRVLRLPLGMVLFSGLAAIALLGRWCVALSVPPSVSGGLVLLLALGGVATALASRHKILATVKTLPVPALLVVSAALIPALIMGTVFAGVEAPVSTHDGAFHVETIDNLRHDIAVPGWYPIGFHAVAAAVLGLVPWLDSARGTAEIGQGIVLLAPLAVLSLGLALGLTPLQASIGGVVQALTFVFPYDNHLWGGWPLGMSLLLLLGLWAVAARWIGNPSASLAALGGMLAGAIVVTHGTEVYSAVVGLAVIAALKWRQIQLVRLARHLPLAIGLAVVGALPYMTTVLGWAASGGATAAGSAVLDNGPAAAERGAGGDWLEFVLGMTGAAGLVDLLPRALLLILGIRGPRTRLALGGWVTFGLLLFAVSFVDIGPVRWLFAVTFPWLVHHRPPQLVLMFASLLVGAGLVQTIDWVRSARPRLVSHPHAWRRMALACGILLGFFAEGSAVSVYKTLDQVITEQNVFSTDDGAAMSWLRQHASPGEVVVNDLAADAGIWAPYKAPVRILMPRSAPWPQFQVREPILANVLDLSASPNAQAEACALHVGYVYVGARTVPDDERQVPARSALERSPNLEEVFTSGQAAIFRIHLPCN